MGRELIITIDGHERTATVEPSADRNRAGAWQLTLDDRVHDIDARQVRPGTWSLLIAGRSYLVDLDPQKLANRPGAVRVLCGVHDELIDVEDARKKRLAAAVSAPDDSRSGEVVRAPIAGKVVTVVVGSGDTVDVGQRTVVLEAMKMENEIKSERGGVVATVHVEAGQSVNAGDALVTLAPAEASAAEAAEAE